MQMCLAKKKLLSKILEITFGAYWNKPKLSQVAYTSQKTANIHCMLDILMSRSNNQVHIDEINENVTEN